MSVLLSLSELKEKRIWLGMIPTRGEFTVLQLGPHGLVEGKMQVYDFFDKHRWLECFWTFLGKRKASKAATRATCLAKTIVTDFLWPNVAYHLLTLVFLSTLAWQLKVTALVLQVCRPPSRHVHIRPALKSALKIALSLNFQFEQNRA